MVGSSVRALALGVALACVAPAALVPPAAQALSRGARAPEIALRDQKGRLVKVSDLRGKVVIVDFWASWCAPCREEMPVLEKLYKKYRDRGLVVVGVGIDRSRGKMKRFLRRANVSFPVVHDPTHKVAGRYDPPRMPSSYVIDRNGVVRHVQEGFSRGDGRKLEAQIKRLLR